MTKKGKNAEKKETTVETPEYTGFKNNHQFLFVYAVQRANPNGDPLTDNRPRFDAWNGRALVSDARTKRTIRDQAMWCGESVFIEGVVETLKARATRYGNALGIKVADIKPQEMCQKHFDTRLFGMVYAEKGNNFHTTGSVQFQDGMSLNKCQIETMQGAGAFKTEEKATARTFRMDYILPYALIAVAGDASVKTAVEQCAEAKLDSLATEEDLEAMKNYLWDGINTLHSRSKRGHTSVLLLDIKWKEGASSILPFPQELVRICGEDEQELTDDEQYALRSIQDHKIDLSPLFERIKESYIDEIESIYIRNIQEVRFTETTMNFIEDFLKEEILVQEEI